MFLNKLTEPEKCPACKLKLKNECEDVEGCTPRPICHRFNHHLVIPLLLLPVILLLLGITRLLARPDHRGLLFKSTAEAFKERHILGEFEDRELISGLKTSFFPVITNTNSLSVLPSPHQRQTKRRRRQLKEIVWNVHDMGNISSVDDVVWATVKPPFRSISREPERSDRRDVKEEKNLHESLQDDEQETLKSKTTDHLIEEKRKSRNFWLGKNDQKSIRKAQAMIMLSLMNMSIDPCVDFYEYACGGWSKAHPIPKNRAGSGTIEILKSNIDKVVRSLLENELDANEGGNINGSDINVNNQRNAKLMLLDESRIIPSSEIQSSSDTLTSAEPNSVLPDLEYLSMPQENNNQRAEISTEKLKTASSLEKLNSEDNNGREIFIEDTLVEYVNNSTFNSNLRNSLKLYNDTKTDLQGSMLQVKMNENKITGRVLAENTSMKGHFSKDNYENVVSISLSDSLGISLNGEDTKHAESKAASSSLSASEDLEAENKPDDFNDANNVKLTREGADLEWTSLIGKKTDNGDLISEQLIKQEEPYTATKKAQNFYKSCMNMDIIDKRGEKPLLMLLGELGGGWPIQTATTNIPFEWTTLAAKLRLYNNNILIAEWVGPDIHNSAEYVVQLDEAGLGLPARDYFLSASSTEFVKAYQQFIITVANLLGATTKDAEKLSEQLVNFEIHLALITASHEEKKNFSDLYHKMTVSELSEIIPGINWRQYLSIVLGSTNPNFNTTSLDSMPVLVFALRYFQDLASLLSKYPPRIIQSYMLWRFASHRAGNLDPRFWAARSQLRKTLTGREEAPPRWESCIAHTTAAVGHAVGSLFVKQHFDEQSKSDTLWMTTEIQAAFRQSILDPDGATASWMDVETRSLAIQKADAMALRVGYPDSILDTNSLDLQYADLTVDPELYFENTLAVLRYLTQREHLLLGNSVDKTLWSAPPTEVNAFYSRNKNQIFLPAGILQPPFYHRHFPRSLNYGGVGVVIGHEMTHGFDDRGRLFDHHGNLQRWWQPTAIEAFQQRAKCLVDQYKQYYVEEVSMQIDGVRTQSENIADNGGLKQAYKAFEDWFKRQKDKYSAEAEETLPDMNYSPHQLFFLNFAQVWCGALRPEAIRNKLKTSIHSLEKFRVIGTLSNSEEFAQAFSCPLGSPMNPEVKCSIW